MTTSEGEARPAERTAGNTESAPGSELSAGGGTRGDVQEAAPLTGRIAAAPDDARQLELEIERTREQLGATVQELFARADVKARARAKATEVSGKYQRTLVQARNQATIRAGSIRSQVAGTWEAMPKQVRRTVTKGASGAREHWMPLAITAGVVIASCLAVREWVLRPSSACRVAHR